MISDTKNKAGMLTDSFNRVHDYLRISVTDQCNFRCTYCMPAEIYGEEFISGKVQMSPEDIFEIARVFTSLGVSKIRLTGGEPLLRRDFHEILIRLSTLPVKLAVSTNGFFTDRFIDTFKTAGLQSVNLSLDSMDEQLFKKMTHRNFYMKVKSNIDELLQQNFHVKLNMVVLKGLNEHEIPDFIQWTKNHSIHIRFIEFMPFRHNDWGADKVVSAAEMLDIVSENYQFEKLKDHPNDTARSFRVSGFRGTFAIISTMTHPFCNTCNRLRLTADGKMKNCLFSTGETDLLQALREGRNLEELIRNDLMLKKEARGGQMDEPLDSLSADKMQNRSMIAIGG